MTLEIRRNVPKGLKLPARPVLLPIAPPPQTDQERFAARLRDVLKEIGFGTTRGIEVKKAAGYIGQESLRVYPERKLRAQVNGVQHLTLGDVVQLSLALRVDARLFLWAESEVPKFKRRRPKTVWERLPQTT